MSQQVAVKPFPPELQKFNWGAFLLSWIWGLGNNTYITLVVFVNLIICWIPVINFVVPIGLFIWLGIKGNQWAWQNKEWNSVEHFNTVQKKWVFWGLMIQLILFVAIILLAFLYVGIVGAALMHAK